MKEDGLEDLQEHEETKEECANEEEAIEEE